jgi:hypothetical protein
MSRSLVLRIASLISVCLMTIHLTSDILLQFASGGLTNLFAIVIFALWTYATLLLTERRSGFIIMFLGSLVGLAVPIVHMKAHGGLFNSEVVRCGDAFVFVWVQLVLGVTALLTAVMSLQALWSFPWRRRGVGSALQT